MSNRSVLVLTNFTSPYQVELFDAVAQTGRCELDVLYLSAKSPLRSWRPRPMNHRHLVLTDRIQESARRRIAAADLVVFNFYDDPRATTLIKDRAQGMRPWCFWGERPGARRSGLLGPIYRRWRLGLLHGSRAPVWGIGRFALEQYRREFGTARMYRDVPYYSNLSRFHVAGRCGRRHPGRTTFLCSGALIRRKGVDLLAGAFLQLAATRRDVRLRFVGDGDLRSALERRLRPVADLVEFAGFRDWDDLPAAYREADVLCVPSRHDGWGMVVPEALAAGLPVIASDRTGAALQFLQPRANGWLIPSNDQAALFAAMADAAAVSDAELCACSAAAVASVASHTLSAGASRFIEAAGESIDGWSTAAA